MAPIETGVYSITNVGRQRAVQLTNGNLGTPVTIAYYADQDSFKWTVTKKRDGIYRIENKGAARKVYTGDQGQPGTEVTARTQDQEWAITETNVSGTYTISTTGTLNNWRCDSGDDASSVTLSHQADNNATWSFAKQH
ncbi:hypothetical protein BDZ89DRAFT_1067938 [Hymenopellis radicata]|nr:hypothetical protein BDZ89DRAFT_1067938 [Hymenopellis radicata]